MRAAMSVKRMLRRHSRKRSAEPADVVVRVGHEMDVDSLRRGGSRVFETQGLCWKAVIACWVIRGHCAMAIVAVLMHVSSCICLVAAGSQGGIAQALIEL